MARDEPSPIDIEAYIDGELDVERVVQVEDYLSRHPLVAARVMADLRIRSALRLLAQSHSQAPAALRREAARLAQKLRRRGVIGRLSVPAMIAALFALLVLTPGDLPLMGTKSASAAPAYVDEAIMSHRTTVLRAAMASQPETTRFDPADLMRATRIRVPSLPKGWRILDVQLFPSDDGPALQLSVQSERGQMLSIFAVRASTSAPMKPTAIRRNGTSIAFWKEEDMSYALTGAATPEDIDRVADDLEDNAFFE